MAISNLLTGRVRVVNPKNVTSDRYQFLDLSQAEPNLGVPNFSASLLTNPAIVVSDDQGNRGFVRSLDLDRVTAKFTGSFTGSFTGDGSELFNLPAATFIASGSSTASFVEGNLFVDTNTIIDGNLYVKDSIYAESLIVTYISSSVIFSSGSNKFGDEITDKQEFTGSIEIRDRVGANEITASSVSSSFTGSFFGVANLTGTFTGSAELTGSFSGSFTGSFFGDGRDLFNLPKATRLSTGSITASVSPDYGFKVESAESGSEFTGSVDISGSLSASLFRGDGSGLFNLPALSATLIASGSVTASVAPDKGLIVTSKEFGSQFTGSIFVSGSRGIELTSGSSFSGSGERLFNIPRAALTPDALISTEIKSGSVTASVAPDFGFRVISAESGSQFTGSLFVTGGIVQ
jgi:hypothetical protein